MAVFKPAGLHVHPSEFSPGEVSLLDRLEGQLGRKLYPVHRLDRPTMGVLVLALDPLTASELSRQFRDQTIDKTYLAVVRGWLPDACRLDHPVQDELGGPARTAVTDFRPVTRYEAPWPWQGFPTTRASLVEARPLTGRRHQIRLHLRKLNHPILGDTSWGDLRLNRHWHDQAALPGLQLFCVAMGLVHPTTGQPLTIASPPLSPAGDFLVRLAKFQLPN